MVSPVGGVELDARPPVCPATDWVQNKAVPAHELRTAARTIALLAVFTLAASPAPAANVFFDSFEVGSTCAWTSSVGAPACCGGLLLEENFTLPNGSGWPAPWTEAGDEVALADVQQGRGRLRPAPSSYSLARMVAPGASAAAEALFTMVFEDAGTQGFGFYSRQNGGYLQQTTPFGQGYAVFVEAFRGPGIGLWTEVGGVEDDIQILFDNALGLLSNVPYRVRFRLEAPPPGSTGAVGAGGRGGPESHLQARVWPVGTPEPAAWQIDLFDSTAVLQGATGGFAIDSWSTRTSAITAHTLVDDIQIFAVCTE
jgi:hypothetical protein